eukprot:COSAG01_NODE_4242_length_5211_cov_24.571401_4_plen_102_part_00
MHHLPVSHGTAELGRSTRVLARHELPVGDSRLGHDRAERPSSGRPAGRPTGGGAATHQCANALRVRGDLGFRARRRLASGAERCALLLPEHRRSERGDCVS